MFTICFVSDRSHVEAFTWSMHVMIQQVALNISPFVFVAHPVVDCLPNWRIVRRFRSLAATSIGAENLRLGLLATTPGDNRFVGNNAGRNCSARQHDLQQLRHVVNVPNECVSLGVSHLMTANILFYAGSKLQRLGMSVLLGLAGHLACDLL